MSRPVPFFVNTAYVIGFLLWVAGLVSMLVNRLHDGPAAPAWLFAVTLLGAVIYLYSGRVRRIILAEARQ